MPKLTLDRKQMQQLVDAAAKAKEATFFLAKDDGAYVGAGRGKSQILFYFDQCHPGNPFCWENCSKAFGGSDFGIVLDIHMIREWIDRPTVQKIAITFDPKRDEVTITGDSDGDV